MNLFMVLNLTLSLLNDLKCLLVCWLSWTWRCGRWKIARDEADAGGSSDNPVVLVQYVNNCAQAITCPVVVTDEAFEEARLAESFVMGSALTESSHLRTGISITHQVRLARPTPIACHRSPDKEMIRDAGRNQNAHAPQALRLKMTREGVYISHRIAVPVWLIFVGCREWWLLQRRLEFSHFHLWTCLASIPIKLPSNWQSSRAKVYRSLVGSSIQVLAVVGFDVPKY